MNSSLTIFLGVEVASLRSVWHGARMDQRTTRAGGCFLTLCILAGFVVGLAIRDPMKGVVIGTGIGAALALLLWLLDRRRTR